MKIVCLSAYPKGIQDVGDFVSSVEHKQIFLTQTVAVWGSYNVSQWNPRLWEKENINRQNQIRAKNDYSSYLSNSNTKNHWGKLCASKNCFVHLLGMHWIFGSRKYMVRRTTQQCPGSPLPQPSSLCRVTLRSIILLSYCSCSPDKLMLVHFLLIYAIWWALLRDLTRK